MGALAAVAHLVVFLAIALGIPITAVCYALHRERPNPDSARRFPGARPDSSGGV